MNKSSTHNKNFYNQFSNGEYYFTAPHLQHIDIHNLYLRLVNNSFELAKTSKKDGDIVVLDIGAGEGTVTKPFLMLGAKVLAVDISENQLSQLKESCIGMLDRLELRCVDIDVVLEENLSYDIIVANSLLHHIPDYLSLIRRSIERLNKSGVFLCFQDPMLNSSMGLRDRFLSWLAYAFWRIGRGDVIGGAARRIRRVFGFYSLNSPHDNTEYHAVRNGVDQNAILELFKENGLVCEVYEYCSLHSKFMQSWGKSLSIKNTFGIIAQRVPVSVEIPREH